MSIFADVMKEELDRNLRKQNIFKKELNSLDGSYLSICKIDNKEYVYAKRRCGKKIVSRYIGPVASEEAFAAQKERDNYLEIKSSLKFLRIEENHLRRAIRAYGNL